MHLKGRRLSFEEKRRIAKIICTGKAWKLIAMDENIAQSTISHIASEFVVTTLTERYTDEDCLKQLQFALD